MEVCINAVGDGSDESSGTDFTITIFYLNVLQSMLFSSVCIYIKILKIASALSAFVPP
jgi:hypothetical protein